MRLHTFQHAGQKDNKVHQPYRKHRAYFESLKPKFPILGPQKQKQFQDMCRVKGYIVN